MEFNGSRGVVMRMALVALVLLGSALACAVPADADLIIGNLPGDDGKQTIIRPSGFPDVGSESTKAVGFDMISASVTYSEVSLNSIALRLQFGADYASTAPVVEIRDGGLGYPGTLVGTLANPAFSEGTGSYSFAPASALTLDAASRYYIVVRNGATTDTSFHWLADDTGITPTGDYATYVAHLTNSTDAPFWAVSGVKNSFAVYGAPVPEPTSLALFGLGAVGLAVYRRRKRKIA